MPAATYLVNRNRIVADLFLLAFLFFPFISSAQYFKIDTIRFESATVDYVESGNIFPELVLDKHWKPASFINEYLHMDFLHVMPHTKGNPFEAISPAEGEIQGTSAVSFNIENNSSRVFSVSVSGDYTSAYSEHFTLFYSFNSQTGEYITLADLFTTESMERIQKKLAEKRVAEVKEFMQVIDTNEETGAMQYQLYKACIPYLLESNLKYEQFYLTDSTITFVHGRCSDHALMALDDLGDYYNSFLLTEVKKELTPFGLALLFGKAVKAKSSPTYPGMKLMKGKIGKTLEVTCIMGRMYDNPNEVDGMYFYNKDGNMITITATLGKLQWDIIEYSGPNVKNAHITGTYKDGVFTGQWKHEGDGRKLPVILKLAHQ